MSDPLDKFLETVRSDVAARVLKRMEPVQAVAAALEAYRRAVAAQVTTEYARDHSLPSPGVGADPAATAAALRDAVARLPELSAPGGAVAAPAASPSAEPKPKAAPDPPSASSKPAESATSDNVKRSGALPVEWGPLVRLVQGAPLVLVGGVTRMERIGFLPREIRDHLEWIDTTRQGTHAIGNLAQRIKVGRVSALLLLEGLVGHRHSDPLVNAARGASVPFAYAGKGGQTALARAFITINQKATALEE